MRAQHRAISPCIGISLVVGTTLGGCGYPDIAFNADAAADGTIDDVRTTGDADSTIVTDADGGPAKDAAAETPSPPECVTSATCDDGNKCNGIETCNTTTHKCVPGVAVVCPSLDPCNPATCEPASGSCKSKFIDADGDGYAPKSLGSCGTDCHDGNASVHPGADYHTTAYAKEDGSGYSFDYDCNGKEDLELPSKGGCGCACDTALVPCPANPGWEVVPACGKTGRLLVTCTGSATGCVCYCTEKWSATTTTQGCR